MSKKQLELLFPQKLIQEPMIWKMSKKFDIVFNIRRARVTDEIGEVVLELKGTREEIAAAVDWLKQNQVKVKPITHDVLE